MSKATTKSPGISTQNSKATNMDRLLSQPASAVADAADRTETTSSLPALVPPIYASSAAPAAQLPLPKSFVAPSYAPPTPLSLASGAAWTRVNVAAIAPTLSVASSAAVPQAIQLEEQEDSEEEFDEDNPEWAKWNCNQIRSRIRKFLATKEMTQTAFLKLIDANSNSYYRFMNLKGPYSGSMNQTYEGAAIFFYRRERDATKEKEAMKKTDRKRKVAEEREERAKKRKDGPELIKRILDTELEEADEDGSVPVYDDCDEIRKKINSFLAEKVTTQTAFLRALGDINANSLRSFFSMKRGAGSGAANVVYRTAYVFFEKKRILEGKKKTKKRMGNEAKQGKDGFELRHDNGMRWVIVPSGWSK
ncbi:hypothetical protein BBJ28_00009984 [Nothophytophthora sp. Chile5]|nr:hypothetical protein BBJ28_00009984 [Nothophytophthora sp. Chile5]